jgi:hypothetical protein
MLKEVKKNPRVLRGGGTRKPKSKLRQGDWDEVLVYIVCFIETQGRWSAGQGKLGQIAGNQVWRLRLEREGLRQGKQVRRGIQGRRRVGNPGQSSRMTRRGTGDRDQSQSGQYCSGDESSIRQGKQAHQDLNRTNG